jgi:hypothetical protein
LSSLGAAVGLAAPDERNEGAVGGDEGEITDGGIQGGAEESGVVG